LHGLNQRVFHTQASNRGMAKRSVLTLVSEDASQDAERGDYDDLATGENNDSEEFDLERKSRRAETVKKDLQMQKTEGGVFSRETLENVAKLGVGGYIDRIMGPISTGKEADVFLGELKGKKIAIKIFRLASASYFRNPTVLQYIIGDERFKKIKQTPHDLIKSWALKEFRNLKKAEEGHVRVPKPIAIEKNVLVMECIGQDKPALQLLKARVDDYGKVFTDIVSQMARMYQADMVHADLSEYNILMLEEKPYIIDYAQGVLLSHPKAEEFLERDVRNICTFFRKKGVDCEPDDVLKKVKEKKVKGRVKRVN